MQTQRFILKFLWPLLYLSFVGGFWGRSQTVDTKSLALDFSLPEIALIDIEPHDGPITLGLSPHSKAGTAPLGTSDHTTWINYSSALAPSGVLRNLRVQIGAGSVPPGMLLQLSAGHYEGSGAGVFGVPNGILTLDYSPQVLIKDIGGAYTNTGVNQGHRLFYTLQITAYADLDASTLEVLTIVFTLTDQ